MHNLPRRASRATGVASVVAAAFALLACVPGAVRADTVWTITSGANAKPFARTKMKIEDLTADGLVFRSATADRSAEPRPLDGIWRIEVDDEPALNAAETAFVGDKWDDAIAGYQKALAASRKEWVKQYATLRLIKAAEKSGKFSAAATAYAAMVQRDLRAAMKAKPDIPADAKAEFPAAIAAVKSALDARPQPAQRAALQAFLAELYIANGQLKEAQALGGKPPVGATAPAAATPAAPAPARNRGEASAPAPRAPAAAAGAASPADGGLKVQLAVASLKQKKFQEAIDQIDSAKDGIIDPGQQATALFTIAEAKAGLAGEDPAKLKDAALAYMRVVAHFKGQPDAPHVAESLLRAGGVLERAKLLPDALAAYQAVQNDFKQSPHAKDAAVGVARVKKEMEARG